jgi:PD-(D/E)XK nuclease superfamily
MTTATVNLRDFPLVEENVERPETLRQSLLARHNHCPRSAYLSLKYDTASVQMDRGTAFHAFVERAIETLAGADEPIMPGEQARELADAVMAERTDLVLPVEEQDAVRLMAWNWAESFVLDWDTIIGVEVPLSMEVGGFTVTGTLDLIEAQGQTLYIRDWKTSLQIRKREEVQRGFQGLMYGLLLLDGVTSNGKSLGAGINDVWFYETYPRYRSDDGTLVAKEGSWTRPELHDFKVSLERNIERFADSLETGDWPARDGSWCSQCPAQTECPIPATLRYEEEITTLQQAEDAFSRKLANERESRRIQGGLRGWVDANGPIFVGDLAFDANHTESRSVKDWELMLAALLRTTTVGAPFEVTDHVQLRQQTKFSKRRQTEEELDEYGSE